MTASTATPLGNRRFWVRFYLQGLVDFGQKTHRYELPDDVVIHLRNLRDPKSDIALPRLAADAECSASSAAEAVDKTRDIVEGMAGFVSVATSATTGMTQPDRAVEMTPGTGDRSLLQYLPWPGQARPMRQLKKSDFAVLWEHLMQKPVQDWGAVARAVRWLRKSLLEIDNLDRFTALWTGLEALNAQVIAKHGLKDKPLRLLECPKCKHVFADAPPLSGAQLIVESTPTIPADTWSKAKKHRNALIHGGGVDKARREAPKLSPDLHKALVWGILDVLEVPKWKRRRLVRAPLKQPEVPYLRVEAVLHGLSAEAITSGKANPRLVVLTRESSIKLLKGGARRETGKLEFRLDGCAGLDCRISVVAMETFWEHDPEKPKPGLQVKLQ